jgi:hypothetical protein
MPPLGACSTEKHKHFFKKCKILASVSGRLMPTDFFSLQTPQKTSTPCTQGVYTYYLHLTNIAPLPHVYKSPHPNPAHICRPSPFNWKTQAFFKKIQKFGVGFGTANANGIFFPPNASKNNHTLHTGGLHILTTLDKHPPLPHVYKPPPPQSCPHVPSVPLW